MARFQLTTQTTEATSRQLGFTAVTSTSTVAFPSLHTKNGRRNTTTMEGKIGPAPIWDNWGAGAFRTCQGDQGSFSAIIDRYPVGLKSTHEKKMQSGRNLDKSVPNKYRSH